MLLVFDVRGGLCNQLYDILCGVNFAIQNKIPFTFRYCTSRNKTMTRETQLNMDQLYDMTYFNTLPLYKDFKSIKHTITKDNTYNITSDVCTRFIDKNNNLYTQINAFGKENVILPFFHTVYDFSKITIPVLRKLAPAKPIFEKYIQIKTKLGLISGEYNYIHYRYEDDFIRHFKIENLPSLSNVIETVTFKNRNLKTYIAAANVQGLLHGCPETKVKQILYKDENELCNLGYEECAFIDLMIGKYSKEVWGNRRSSFSGALNSMHNTNNFYC